MAELAPPNRAGASVISEKAYAYTYWKRVSKLYVVKGAVIH